MKSRKRGYTPPPRRERGIQIVRRAHINDPPPHVLKKQDF